MSDSTYSARIICCHRNVVVVETDSGELRRAHPKKNVALLVCGDRVSCTRGTHNKDTVTALEARDNLLTRQSDKGRQLVAANVDQCVIVIAYLPAPQSLLLDHYLIACKNLDVRPILILNKTDLRKEGDDGMRIESLTVRYEQLGCITLRTSAKTGSGIAALATQLKNRTSIFVGQSGVGKSSLAMKLDPDVNARVGAISQAGGAGRHTTTSTTLYHLKNNGDLIDSPGVRSYAYPVSSLEEAHKGFFEFNEYAAKCRFRNCAHIEEPDCGVKQAVEERLISEERYQNYLLIANALVKTS